MHIYHDQLLWLHHLFHSQTQAQASIQDHKPQQLFHGHNSCSTEIVILQALFQYKVGFQFTMITSDKQLS